MEIIVVIVITSIVAAMVATFIRLPFLSYVDVAARAELTDVADTALRRMGRDLRLALPNSVRITKVSDNKYYLEMLLTKTGGRYLVEEETVNGRFLQFERPTLDCVATPLDPGCAFDVVGNMPAAPLNIVVGDKIVVYNLGLAPADAYSGGNLTTVTSVVGNRINFAPQVFATQVPAMRSPSHRFQVVSTPVTYFCDGSFSGGSGKLLRYSGYAISANQPMPPVGGKSALLADGIVKCSLNYEQVANVHSALVGMTISMARPNKDTGTVQLFNQVHVDNTP